MAFKYTFILSEESQNTVKTLSKDKIKSLKRWYFKASLTLLFSFSVWFDNFYKFPTLPNHWYINISIFDNLSIMLVNISICGSSVGQLKIIFIIYLAHIKGIKGQFFNHLFTLDTKYKVK